MQTFGKSISSRRYDWSWSITLYGIWSVDCVMVAAVTLMTDAECSPAPVFLFPVILITSCLFLTSPSILLTCILKLQSKNLIALHI